MKQIISFSLIGVFVGIIAWVGVTQSNTIFSFVSRGNEKVFEQKSDTKNNTLKESLTKTKVQEEVGIPLSILEPQDGSITTVGNIKVAGKTLPSASVFINDQETNADSVGNFVTAYTLDEGENTLVFVANDEQGNFSELIILVTLETPVL